MPWLLPAMACLVLASGFFSSSEAALFMLNAQDRRLMAVGGPAEQIAASLLRDPDRLLTAVLFWNLLINITYFALVAIAGLRLERQGAAADAGLFALVALLAMIMLSEMLPKTFGLLLSRRLARLVAVPIAVAVRVISPLIPVFHLVNLLSQRMLWPRFRAEPYLEVADLEKAVELSTTDSTILEQERAVLQNIVSLSEIRAEELMRPRMRFVTFSPPVSLADLEGRQPPSGYILVTERDSDEVAGAIPLKQLYSIPPKHLEHHAERVIYVPWCATAGDTFEMMRVQDRSVAAVVNEHGETIGILTRDDILDTIFSFDMSRSERLLKQSPIEPDGANRWRVTGMTTIRRLSREFGVELPETHSVTIAGVVQESLGRLPAVGDECQWGPFLFAVIEMHDQGHLVLRMSLTVEAEESP
ncbi:MAG: DUF21 domain-containing protein [Planctomycetota bacterium]|nr:MAG: DUF21 domain-containing protein [Planctomycetota bacterium]REK46068.1 MAG: DUF21 domain-containing protein [Planctomycetota bacterium]